MSSNQELKVFGGIAYCVVIIMTISTFGFLSSSSWDSGILQDNFYFQNTEQVYEDWQLPFIEAIRVEDEAEGCGEDEVPLFAYSWFGKREVWTAPAGSFGYDSKSDCPEKTKSCVRQPAFPMVKASVFDGKRFCGKVQSLEVLQDSKPGVLGTIFADETGQCPPDTIPCPSLVPSADRSCLLRPLSLYFASEVQIIRDHCPITVVRFTESRRRSFPGFKQIKFNSSHSLFYSKDASSPPITEFRTSEGQPCMDKYSHTSSNRTVYQQQNEYTFYQLNRSSGYDSGFRKNVFINNCPPEANSRLFFDPRYKPVTFFELKTFLEGNGIRDILEFNPEASSTIELSGYNEQFDELEMASRVSYVFSSSKFELSSKLNVTMYTRPAQMLDAACSLSKQEVFDSIERAREIFLISTRSLLGKPQLSHFDKASKRGEKAFLWSIVGIFATVIVSFLSLRFVFDYPIIVMPAVYAMICVLMIGSLVTGNKYKSSVEENLEFLRSEYTSLSDCMADPLSKTNDVSFNLYTSKIESELDTIGSWSVVGYTLLSPLVIALLILGSMGTQYCFGTISLWDRFKLNAKEWAKIYQFSM